METLSRLRPLIIVALTCAVMVTLSILYVDRPVERYILAHIHKKGATFFDLLAAPSLFPLPGACTYLVFYTLRSAAGRPAGARASLYLALSIAVSVATMAKDEMKWVIGRPWPLTWAKFGVYKIHPFTNNLFYGSFPSGHTTYIAAPMFVLWWRLPKYRPLWLAIIFLVMVGLVGSEHHFVSDVIAGLFLGLAAAAGTLAVGPTLALQGL